MQKIFTKSFMKANRGCYDRDKKVESIVLKGRTEITLKDFLTCDIPLKDKYWFVCKKIATKEENQQIAILVAESVLFVYEKKYPSDLRPRMAIQAAKDFLAGKIDLVSLKSAAAASAAANYDSYVGYAAAAAADAASYASYTAAANDDDDAASSASYASYASYAAAANDNDDALKEILLVLLVNFCENTK